MASIKVHQNIEQGLEGNPELLRYASKLKAMDKDGNGVLDMDEVCHAIDTMVQQESQNRLLKKVAIVSGILSLLTIAAVVGLTAGVIILSKDIEDNDNVLRSTSSGSAMATAEFLDTMHLDDILANPDPVALSSIKTMMLPGNNGVNFTIHSVEYTAVNTDGSITFSLGSGTTVTYSLDSSGDVSVEYDTITENTSTKSRRLLAEIAPATQENCKNQYDDMCIVNECKYYCGLTPDCTNNQCTSSNEPTIAGCSCSSTCDNACDACGNKVPGAPADCMCAQVFSDSCVPSLIAVDCSNVKCKQGVPTDPALKSCLCPSALSGGSHKK